MDQRRLDAFERELAVGIGFIHARAFGDAWHHSSGPMFLASPRRCRTSDLTWRCCDARGVSVIFVKLSARSFAWFSPRPLRSSAATPRATRAVRASACSSPTRGWRPQSKRLWTRALVRAISLSSPNAGTTRRVSRAVLVAVLVGLASGIGGFALGRYTHIFERHAAADAELEKLVARAESALVAERFDEPANDNVLDATDQILAKRPDDARASELRLRAANRLVRRGLLRKASGDPAAALKDYNLAARFTRADHGLLEEIEATKRDLAKLGK